jgi:hypothetical protein
MNATIDNAEWKTTRPNQSGEYWAKYNECSMPFKVTVLLKKEYKNFQWIFPGMPGSYMSVTPSFAWKYISDEERQNPDYLDKIKYWRKIK